MIERRKHLDSESILALFWFHQLLEFLLAHLPIAIVVKLGKNGLNLLLCHLLGDLRVNFSRKRGENILVEIKIKFHLVTSHHHVIFGTKYNFKLKKKNLCKLCPGDKAVLVLVEQLECCVRWTHHLHLEIVSNIKLKNF